MNKVLVAIVLVVIVGLLAFFFIRQPSREPAPASEREASSGTAAQPAQANPEAPGPDAGIDVSASVSVNTVRFTADGFSPREITVKKGMTVTFVNQSNEAMWVASDPHPSHTGYDGTDRTAHCAASASAFDQCGSGSTYSFTFEKTGTWSFHNHLDPLYHGQVTVTD